MGIIHSKASRTGTTEGDLQPPTRKEAVGPPYIIGWLLPLLILITWQFGSTLGWFNAALVPPPSRVLSACIELLVNGTLLHHLWISTVRVAIGSLLGIIPGTLFGAYVGLSRWGERFFDPTFQMVRTIPVLALTPLFILWFGIGELPKVLLLAFATFFPAYINTFAGTRDVDRKLIEIGIVYDLTPLQSLREIILPAALPHVLTGVRYGLQVAWLVLIVAEMLGATAGIGFMIRESQSFMRTDRVMLGIIIFALTGKAVDQLLRWLEQRLLGWRDAFSGN